MFQLRFIAMAALAAVLSAPGFAATKYAVGSCQPKLRSYATISAAVSNVPSGSTILVCAGNYPEQVLITQPLTLEGVVGGSEAAVVVPPGGLVQSVNNDVNVGPVYYQILVETTGPVNITNLAVDGTGGNSPVAGGIVAGLFYEDSSGTVEYVSARNQTNTGIGILVLTNGYPNTITVENSVVRGFDDRGIWVLSNEAGGLAANIKDNTIEGWPAGGASNMVGFVSAGANCIFQSNMINNVYLGLLLADSDVTTTSNTISALYAIELTNDSSTITGNTIVQRGGSPAIYIEGGTTNLQGNRIDAGGQEGLILGGGGSAIVELNTIMNSSIAVDGCAESASGFTVTGNTITDAAIGVQMPSGNTTTLNKFYATAMAVEACP
jgi:hypothetical protein